MKMVNFNPIRSSQVSIWFALKFENLYELITIAIDLAQLKQASFQ